MPNEPKASARSKNFARTSRPRKCEGRVIDVDAISARILRDDHQFLDAGGGEPLRFAQHLGRRARHEIAAQRGNDAEAAAIVAALRNLQIGEVARCQLDAALGHEVEARIVPRGGDGMDRLDDRLVGLRSGDGRDVGIGLQDRAGVATHAAGDDDLAVLGQSLTDGGERFGLGAVDEAAGVDDDGIGAAMTFRQRIPLGPQLRDDSLAVDERLWAAERDEGEGRRGGR